MIYAEALAQAKKEADTAEANYVAHPNSDRFFAEMQEALHRLRCLQKGDYDVQITSKGRQN